MGPHYPGGRMMDTRPDNTVSDLWRDALVSSKEASQRRRERVLSHEDLAKRLTEPPLALSDPRRWSGWIPPRTAPEECCSSCGTASTRPPCRGWEHRSRVADSPVRRQLVLIVAEAMAREQGR